MLTQFINCRLLRHDGFVRDDLWVQDGKIIDPQRWFFESKSKADVVVDCQGHILAPGFVDIQINGAFGVDFSAHAADFTPEELRAGLNKVALGLLSHGVTAFCPTVITSSPATFQAVLPHLERFEGGAHGAANVGAHVEGPFINRAKKGAHPEQLIRNFTDRSLADFPDAVTTDNWMAAAGSLQAAAGAGEAAEEAEAAITGCYGDVSNIAMVTLAPELTLAPEAIAHFRKHGIVVSVGHSRADLATGELACQVGATMITHLFNAMTAFHHRDPGLVGLLSSENVHRTDNKETITETSQFYSIIVDGIHTHNAAIRMAYSTHPAGCVLVTDAMCAMGLPPGTHSLGEVDVIVDHNLRATVAGSPPPGTLAGSVASMDFCVRKFAPIAGQHGALEAASLHPAQALGLTSKGRLDWGCDADIVLVNDSLEVVCTYIAGVEVYRA